MSGSGPLHSRWMPFAGFLLLVLLVDWGNGTFRSEFGRYPDEGMHYISAILIRDFVTAGAGAWTHPMQFALNFYSHFPKVGLGNWPPVFELLQTAWGLLFGISRPAMLLGMAVLTALLAAATFRLASRHTHPLAALAAVTAVIVAPLTQAQTAMVMAEIPLALFSLLAVNAWLRFIASGRRRDAVVFGLWTAVAILTKGNAWVVPLLVAVAIVCQSRWRLLRTGPFWMAAAIVAVLCVPYTLFTMSIVVQGWNERSIPDPGFLVASLGRHHGFVAELLGWPLYVLVWVGLVDRVLAPLARRRPVDPVWSTMALYGLLIIVFHAVVPTSIEPRKIYQIAPVLGFFLAGGLDALARGLAAAVSAMRQSPVPAQAAAIGIAALGFAANGFAWIDPFVPGFGPAVAAVAASPDSRGEAILTASDRTFDDAEAAIIAEWLSREPGDLRTYMVRGSKLLSGLGANAAGQPDFEPYDRTPEELERRLLAVPVAYVILHNTGAGHPYRHQRVLTTAMEQFPQNWELIHSSEREALGVTQDLRVYRNRRDVHGIPIQFEIDLSQKLGAPVVVGPEQAGQR